MNAYLNTHDAIEDGLDRQNLAILEKRFLSVNEDRLERMRGALSDRAQLFMDALPLLFHCNHPMLPGYVSRKTPSRISHFKPSKRDILIGKMIAKSFTINYDPGFNDEIYGLYIMGSVGTIAQSERSDLDIWVCLKPGLEPKQTAELRRKCDKISQWAEEMKLEAHFFLMDHEAFKTQKFGQLDKESSGSAQHLLLLDEFYRSAIFIAGRTPVWWYVPRASEDYYKEYTNTLLYKRFTPTESVLDFGGVAQIPAGEFLGAGIWQLYKAIESPYKSILKLLLLESYVTDYPNIQPLSLTYKNMIYDGTLDINELDSYVMIYRRIENYLIKKEEYKRLELARRCFYFKVNKALSRPPKDRSKSWQRQILEDLTEEWGWPKAYLRFLDSRNQWKAADVAREYRLLVRELKHCYRFLFKFANTEGQQRAIKAEELKLLGRKLQAAYEQRPGKIENVNPSISSDLSESILVISPTKERDTFEEAWTAYSHESSAAASEAGAPVRSAENLVELLLWCYCNGVLTQGTRVELQNNQALSGLELKRLISVFRSWLPLPLDPSDDRSFHKAAVAQKVCLLINAGKSPTPDLDQRGLQMMSNKTDALNYGSAEENLVVSVDLVILNSWNEVSVTRFEGDDALISAALETMKMTLPDTTQKPPKIRVACIGSGHGSTINSRLTEWFNQLSLCFFSGRNTRHKRFIFQTGGAYSCLQFRGMLPLARSFYSLAHLIDHLEQEQDAFSPIVLEKTVLKNHPLRIIAATNRPNAIDVYFSRFDFGMEVFVSDEKGSIIQHTFKGRKHENPLRQLHRFLRAMVNRRAEQNDNFEADFGIFPINFIEIGKSNDGSMITQQRTITMDSNSSSTMQVCAKALIGEQGDPVYNYRCDEQEFDESKYRDQLDLTVSQYIIGRRNADSTYPVYINDLDIDSVAEKVSQTGNLQTVHYLRIKNRLEARLNQAIGILLNA